MAKTEYFIKHKPTLFLNALTVTLACFLSFGLAILCPFVFSAPPSHSNPKLNKQKLSDEINSAASIETVYFTIRYDRDVNLNKVLRQINMRRLYLSGWQTTSESAGTGDKLANRVNILLQNVKEILGMFIKSPPFTIMIFSDQEDLFAEYARLTKRAQAVEAFYHHESKTIYTSEDTISDSVLAHELAHYVILHYFLVDPPEKISEMMAVYVDENLQGERLSKYVFRKEFRKK